jgi:hypothetical protein
MTPTEDFTWVHERYECSLSKVFNLLRKQVRGDVEAREKMVPREDFRLGPGASHHFAFVDGATNFEVTLEGRGLSERVSFLREPRTIKATNTNGELIIEGSPTLNPEGICVLKIASKEFPVWYFRKLALEELFFESGATPQE